MRSRVTRGYLYLIRVSRWPELHKVGITQNPTGRFLSFEDSNPKGNRLLRIIYVKGYDRKEEWIKDYFSNRAKFFHPFRDNGATEVFRFTWLDLAIVTTCMEWWALMDNWKFRLGWYLTLTLAPVVAISIWAPWVIDLIVYLIKKGI